MSRPQLQSHLVPDSLLSKSTIDEKTDTPTREEIEEQIDEKTTQIRADFLDTIKKKISEKGLKPKEAEAVFNEILIDFVNYMFVNFTRPLNNVLSTIEPVDLEEQTDEYQIDIHAYIWTIISIVLFHSLGDTMGYKNGDWEFNYGNPREGPEYVNELIYEFLDLGGVNDISINGWRASDDTILYYATLEALLTPGLNTIDDYGEKFREVYLARVPLIQTRHPGETTKLSLREQRSLRKWSDLRYDSVDIGAGSAMRSGCIGILFPGEASRERLVTLAIESSRITHNSATAMLGSITAALFTAYALERIDITLWPINLVKLIRSGMIDEYLKVSRPHEYQNYREDYHLFLEKWERYIRILPPGSGPRDEGKRMRNPVERYRYLADNFSKGYDIPGSCGDDAVIMAYDSVKRSRGNFEKLILYSVLHPGDSDTVGSIAFSWFAAYYLSEGVIQISSPMLNDLEFSDYFNENLRDKLVVAAGDVLFNKLYMERAMKIINSH
jgi:ADP-ribosylglycohydrolase